jgi:predicted Rossmann fold flavoprotein
LIKLKTGESRPTSRADGENFQAHKLILTTGGNAYSQTGSSGDGYAFAKALGHSINTLAPSLSSFYTAEKWVSELSGISFKKAHFIFLSPQNSSTQNTSGPRRFERTGPFLFTHKGVSGPAIFALSAMAAYENYSTENPAKLLIDFFPELGTEQLEQQLIEKFNQNPAKKLLNVLGFIVPHRLAEKILSETTTLLHLKTAPDQINCSEVSKSLRQHLLKQLKSFELHLVGKGTGDEFVTAGGVPLTEVHSKTMQSRLTPGLFFAGELLDVDGFTGGFNLQASWATGALAGESC